MITVTDKVILFFWGLEEKTIASTNSGWGCPIGLYKSLAFHTAGFTTTATTGYQ